MSAMSSATHAQRRMSLVQMHVAVILAGGTGLFPKYLATSPMVTACVRCFFGAATLFLIARVLGISLRLDRGRTLVAFMLSGVILAFHWFAFFQAIAVSTVAIGVLGFGSLTLFSTFLEPLVFRERLRAVDVATGALVVAGLLLITPEFDLGNTHTQGLLWGIASGFLYAIFFLITRSSVRAVPPVTVAMYQQGFAGVVLLPLVWTTVGATSGRDWATLLLLGVVFTGLMQWMVASSLRHIKVQTGSVLLSLEPVYAILLAWALLSERPDLRTVAGGVLLCGAVLWTSLRPRRSA
jgi:drug/metabolite transporter (DMT)-like permease